MGWHIHFLKKSYFSSYVFVFFLIFFIIWEKTMDQICQNQNTSFTMAQKSQHQTCFIPIFAFISIPDTLLIRTELPAFAHLKGASICLMYHYPKRLSFIPTMGLKVHPHFQTILINTLSSVFVSLCPTTSYLSLSEVCPLFRQRLVS